MSVCVCANTRWLCTSRLSKTEIIRGDSDRDGNPWFQWHSRRVRNGRDEGLGVTAHEWKDGDKEGLMIACIRCGPLSRGQTSGPRYKYARRK